MTEIAIVDTLYLVPHDTLSISRPESLFAMLQQPQRTLADWALVIIPSVLSLASFIAVIWGWRVAHRNEVRAQSKALFDKIIYDEGQILSAALHRSFRWQMNRANTARFVASTGTVSPTLVISIAKASLDPDKNDWAPMVEASGVVLWQIVPQYFEAASDIVDRLHRAEQMFEHAMIYIGSSESDEIVTILLAAADAYEVVGKALLRYRSRIVERVLVEIFPDHSVPFSQRTEEEMDWFAPQRTEQE